MTIPATVEPSTVRAFRLPTWRGIRAGVLGAAAVWACGAWTAMGTIAPAGEGSVARLGVLPPWWALALLLVGAAIYVAIVRPGRREAAPLWLGGLALLPWLPVPVPPAFLLLAGPIGIAFVLAGLIGAVAAMAPPLGSGPRVDARGSWVAIAVALAVYSLAAWRLAPVVPGGDEPHYLVIAQSLLTDGDLRIENNHQRRDYAPYFDGELRPDYLRRGQDGEIYSIHAPGLAAAIAPAYGAGGYPAVVLLLALVSAAGTLLAARAASQVPGSGGGALVAWAAVAFSAPFFFQAFTIYPDGPAAVLVMAAVWGLAQSRLPVAGPPLALIGVLLGALPWLHTRFAILAGAIGLAYALRIVAPPGKRRPAAAWWTDLAWLAAPALVSLAAWLAFFYAVYGVFDPRAPYGHATDMRLARIPHGLAGLLLDQQFGLLPNAPVYLLAFAGLPALWRVNQRFTAELVLALTPYVIAVAAHHMWWGGRSSPARFLVPVLLPAALPIAAWWAAHATRTARRVALVLLGTSLALTAVLTLGRDGLLLYNSRDGFALWLDAAAPSVNLAYALPSLFQTEPAGAFMRALMWAVLIAAAGWGLRALERRGVARPVWWSAAGGAAAAVLLAGASIGWAVARRSGVEPGAGRQAVAARACDDRGHAVRLLPFGAGSPRALFGGLDLPDGSRRPQAPRSPSWFGRDLPPGRYRVRLETGLAGDGLLNIALGRREAVVQQCTFEHAAPGPTACTLDLPAGASALWLLPDERFARTIEALSIEVVEPGAAAACESRAVRAVTNRAGTLFVTGGRAFAERSGLWVAGGSLAELVAASGPPRQATLVIRNGAVPNRVSVSAPGWDEAWVLAPGDARTVPVPSSTVMGPVAPITITSEAGFRPGEVDPASNDHRLLGVWVAMVGEEGGGRREEGLVGIRDQGSGIRD